MGKVPDRAWTACVRPPQAGAFLAPDPRAASYMPWESQLVNSPYVRRHRFIAVAVALLAAGLIGSTAAVAGPGHTGIVGSEPTNDTPDIQDGSTSAIYDAGSKVIAVGNFTTVQNRNTNIDIPRNFVLAFDKATGLVD